MATSLEPDTRLTLSTDDRVLLHAISMAGDAVREADVAYLLGRWPWATAMDRSRVDELEAEGLLQRTDDGWFVPLAVDMEAAAELPKALDPMLKGLVGEMLCRHADTFDRFQQGFRRMIAGGRDHALVAVSRAWAASPASQNGPRGARFVDALGAKRLAPELRERLREAVPDLRAPSAWARPFRLLAARVAGQPGFQRAAAAAAAAAFVALELLGRTSHVLTEFDRR